jgi:hypothetical protein
MGSMIKNKVQSWIDLQENNQKQYYANNPKVPRFKSPSDSMIYERIMRLGIEARALDVDDEDELYQIAISTLHNDYIKYQQAS